MLRWLIVFLTLLVQTSLVFANPPTRLWRIDGRSPQSGANIFQNGFQAYGDNFNLFSHTYGSSNIAAEEGGTPRNDGFISTSSSREASIEYLENRLESGLFRSRRSYWLYEIIPSSNAYSFETTVLDGIQRHETGEQPLSETDLASLREFRWHYLHMREWLVSQRIEPESIMTATELIVDSRGNVREGRTLINPNRIETTPAPNPQALPLGGSANPEDPSVLDSLPNGLIAAAASFMMCSSPQRQLRTTGKPAECQELAKTPTVQKESDSLTKLKQQKGTDIKLVFRLRNGGDYCLANSSNYPSLNYCKNGLTLRYTVDGLIQTKIGNKVMCLAMPNGYDASGFKWDYLQFKICAINDISQVWEILRPTGQSWSLQHKSSKLIITEHKWTLMAGKAGYEGYKLVFSDNGAQYGMPKDFFYGTLGYNQNYLLNIRWKGPNGIIWYPDGFGRSSSTPLPTYYDKFSSQWSILKDGVLYCIKSTRNLTKLGLLNWSGSCSLPADPTGVWYFNRSNDKTLKDVYYMVTNQKGERLLVDKSSLTFNWYTKEKSETIFNTDSHFLVDPNIFN